MPEIVVGGKIKAIHNKQDDYRAGWQPRLPCIKVGLWWNTLLIHLTRLAKHSLEDSRECEVPVTRAHTPESSVHKKNKILLKDYHTRKLIIQYSTVEGASLGAKVSGAEHNPRE